MKSIQVLFDKASNQISTKEGAEPESWDTVCKKFNDDVSRICDVSEKEDYTGLFECRDDDNNLCFYLVKEDKTLYRMKHRHFFDNIGLK